MSKRIKIDAPSKNYWPSSINFVVISSLRCGVVRLLLRRSLEELRPTHTHYQFTGKYTSLHLTRVFFFAGSFIPFCKSPDIHLETVNVCYT